MKQSALSGKNVHLVDIVISRIAIVQANEDFFRKAMAYRFNFCADRGTFFCARRQVRRRNEIADISRIEVDSVYAVVFIPVLILAVEDVVARIGPEEGANASVGVFGNRFGCGWVINGCRPYVEDTIERCKESNLFAIGTDFWADPIGIAEKRFARD